MFTEKHVGKVIFYDVFNCGSQKTFKNYISFLHSLEDKYTAVMTDYVIVSDDEGSKLTNESCYLDNLTITINRVMSFREFQNKHLELLI